MLLTLRGVIRSFVEGGLSTWVCSVISDNLITGAAVLVSALLALFISVGNR